MTEEVVRNVRVVRTDHAVLMLEDGEGKILKVLPLPSGLRLEGAEVTEIVKFRAGMLPRLYAVFPEPATCTVSPEKIMVCGYGSRDRTVQRTPPTGGE
jgi:hypothetical protein